MSTQDGWRIAAASVAWRDFDGEVVAYHDETGSTHHLAPFASTVFRLLAEHRSGLDLPALLDLLSAESSIPPDALCDDLERTLGEFEQAKLVAPAAP